MLVHVTEETHIQTKIRTVWLRFVWTVENFIGCSRDDLANETFCSEPQDFTNGLHDHKNTT